MKKLVFCFVLVMSVAIGEGLYIVNLHGQLASAQADALVVSDQVESEESYANPYLPTSFVDPNPDDPSLVIIPEHRWIEIVNEKVVNNGNVNFHYGDSAIIKKGRCLRKIGEDGDRVLVRYVSRDQFGTNAPNGAMFFLPKGEFVQMTSDYLDKRRDEGKAKDTVKKLVEQYSQSERY